MQLSPERCRGFRRGFISQRYRWDVKVRVEFCFQLTVSACQIRKSYYYPVIGVWQPVDSLFFFPEFSRGGTT
jgi:hypothetical protein